MKRFVATGSQGLVLDVEHQGNRSWVVTCRENPRSILAGDGQYGRGIDGYSETVTACSAIHAILQAGYPASNIYTVVAC